MSTEAQKPAPTLPAKIGKSLARKIFEQRGNHSEAHLTEPELAAIIEAACDAQAALLQKAVQS